jgi:drug/metabolite transporter (DMT)-like permease
LSTSQTQHRNAVIVLVLCNVLWSTAGLGTRYLEHANGFEITFWRSLACTLFMLAHYWWIWSPSSHTSPSRWGAPWHAIKAGGWLTLACGFMWCGMFVCFLVALTLTSVANTLLTMAIAPLLASVLTWLVLRERIYALTWLAIAAAGFGMFWMLRDSLFANGPGASANNSLGMLVALGVPICSALNLIIMKFGVPPRRKVAVDFSSAVLIGGILSCVIMLAAAFPLKANAHDIVILSLLGIFQLGLPCLLMVRVTRHLAAQETALLSLLEVLFGPLWVWLAFSEQPTNATLQGGLIILCALIANELWLKAPKAPKTPNIQA